MNKVSFNQYVENNRDCDRDRLERAVNLGLARAKSDRLDTRKLLCLPLRACSLWRCVLP